MAQFGRSLSRLVFLRRGEVLFELLHSIALDHELLAVVVLGQHNLPLCFFYQVILVSYLSFCQVLWDSADRVHIYGGSHPR